MAADLLPTGGVTDGVTDGDATADLSSSFTPISADGALQKRILTAGHGAQPPRGSKVSVHYTGTLLSGEKFDSSVDRGELFQFTLGKGMVIKGWDEGVATMRLGERAILRCPPDYAYGAHGSPPKIPGGATLLFEVELHDFEEPADTPVKRLDVAGKLKTDGNAAFKEGDFGKAVRHYEKATGYLADKHLATPEQTKLMADLELSLYANIAACQLKAQDARAALVACNKVLAIDATNVKAAFRMGQAHNMLGEFDLATKALEKAQELAPVADPAIALELEKVQQNRAKLAQKERQMFGKLFA